VITTIAGSGESGYDGDDKPATEAALNTPSAVAAAPNGDIYIADTLNNRIRVIAHATGRIYTVAGTGETAEHGEPIGDNGPATDAALFMPADVALAPNGDIYIADMHHNRVRRVDARTKIITTVAGNGTFGAAGDDGPAIAASLAGPAGLAVVEDTLGRLTLFIADSYNGSIRSVTPDGIMHNVSVEGPVKFETPSRVAFAPGTEWLYVADSSNDKIVVLNIPSGSLTSRARAIPASPRAPAKKVG
jgi:DNA-binding beta-propeller fold protein YncE